MKYAALALLLAACDPIWGVNVHVRDPANRPIETATLAVACAEDARYPATQMSVHTAPTGAAHVVGMGTIFPVGCDVFVAKPGFVTQRIRYRDLCPNGPEGCMRVFAFDLVLVPES